MYIKVLEHCLGPCRRVGVLRQATDMASIMAVASHVIDILAFQDRCLGAIRLLQAGTIHYIDLRLWVVSAARVVVLLLNCYILSGTP